MSHLPSFGSLLIFLSVFPFSGTMNNPTIKKVGILQLIWHKQYYSKYQSTQSLHLSKNISVRQIHRYRILVWRINSYDSAFLIVERIFWIPIDFCQIPYYNCYYLYVHRQYASFLLKPHQQSPPSVSPFDFCQMVKI